MRSVPSKLAAATAEPLAAGLALAAPDAAGLALALSAPEAAGLDAGVLAVGALGVGAAPPPHAARKRATTPRLMSLLIIERYLFSGRSLATMLP